MKALKTAQTDEIAIARAKLLQGHGNSQALPTQLEPHMYQMSGHGQQPQRKSVVIGVAIQTMFLPSVHFSLQSVITVEKWATSRELKAVTGQETP